MANDFPKRSYAPRPRAEERRVAADTAWERPAAWYDQLIGSGGDDFYRDLILPAVLERLSAKVGQRVLDVCCGQGVLGRVLALQGLKTLGVDASPSLVEAAKGRAGAMEKHLVGDARDLAAALDGLPDNGVCDHAALIMCLQDLDPITPVLRGVKAHVKPGGRVVIVMTHPCFRIPRHSSWGWDEVKDIQFRRLDGYMSEIQVPIKTHPGMPEDASRTTSFHRPLSTYLSSLGDAGLALIACDELCSHRRGTKGVRYAAEDRSAREFPVFLVLTAEHRRG